ncbi:hypothetical protein BDZ94DRAFT_1224662 [Collybia nuda]|uniref:SET domain-containing protein n=1 Tax=Collybia nuda TaxID=64659 RepID=A0A9P5XXA1_9AGAR|nr:hypothetical protein BDZ94DRAFT_1224662 [Collybia nuda]
MNPKPSHWPPHLQYIQTSLYHSSVSIDTQLQIQGPENPSFFSRRYNINRRVVIRPISSPSHPACGQYGLFAVKKIPPKTHIIDYIGEIHCDDRPDSDYDLSLYRSQDGLHVGIDSSTMGNEARFINDYRGVKPKPNAVFSDIRADSGAMRMSIWSSGGEIKKGEEILVSYGKAWWHARNNLQ